MPTKLTTAVMALAALWGLNGTASAQTDAEPNFAMIATVTLKNGAQPQFEEFQRKFSAAAKQVESPIHFMVSTNLVGGGGHPTYYLVFPMQKFGDRDGWAEWGPFDVLRKAYGQEEAVRLVGLVSDATLTRESIIVGYRSELSYP